MRRRYNAGSKHVIARLTHETDETTTLQVDYAKNLEKISSTATISTSTWIDDSGNITVDSESETATVATVTISGGNHGQRVFLENAVTTNGGDVIKRAFVIQVRELTSDFIANDYPI